MKRIDRRAFLARSALALPALSLTTPLRTDAYPGMTVRQAQPENLEAPFSELDSFLTPSDRFYVRSHFAVPKIDAATFRLRVQGAVARPLDLTLDDLRGLGARRRVATLECAGNGRVFLKPGVGGLQWGLGAVGNAQWNGVPLNRVLEKAGIKDSAVEVVLEGADRGPVMSEPRSPGPISFARSLPLDKAMSEEVILAWGMNDGPLPPSHGSPLRAVVPGWYGMASIKWLNRIVVVEKRFAGYWQTFGYTYFERRDGLPNVVPVTEMLVKSSIARPTVGEVIPVGKPYRVTGAAWAGDSAIRGVEISADEGKSWKPSRLTGEAVPFAWRFWEFDWTPTRNGPAKLMARATDAKGNTQPMERDPDRLSYMINHVIPVDVNVR